jgi:hypothetical protein
MSNTTLDFADPDMQLASLPLTIEHASSRTSNAIMLALLVPALAILIIPLGLLAAFATPAVSAGANNPVAAAQAFIGLCMWTALFALPCKRLIQHFGRAQHIHIEAGVVSVSERGAIGCRDWNAPLSEFCGVAHHVRATLSGWRHELILVHPDRSKRLLLCASDAIPHSTIERAAKLLGVAQIPAAALFQSGTRERAPSAPAMLPAAA